MTRDRCGVCDFGVEGLCVTHDQCGVCDFVVEIPVVEELFVEGDRCGVCDFGVEGLCVRGGVGGPTDLDGDGDGEVRTTDGIFTKSN